MCFLFVFTSSRVEPEVPVSSEANLLMLCDVEEPQIGEHVVDWNNLQIVERQDDEGRVEMLTEDQLYALLGLRDEDEMAETRLGGTDQVRTTTRSGQLDYTGGAIPVSDHIPDEIVIAWDKDHPVMNLGTMYPTMNDFRMAIRQFAINEEFALGTEKSDKKRFRGFCKSSPDCPWRIVGTRQDDNRTIKVLF